MPELRPQPRARLCEIGRVPQPPRASVFTIRKVGTVFQVCSKVRECAKTVGALGQRALKEAGSGN